MAAFRPVFSVRVLRLDALVDFVLAGRSCGCVDLNSAVCPPRLKFDASFTARYRSEVWLCFYTSAYDTISAPDRLRGSRKLAAGKTLASTPGSKSSAKLITRSTMQVSSPHSRPLFRFTYRCQKRAESLPRCAAAPRGESASPPAGGSSRLVGARRGARAPGARSGGSARALWRPRRRPRRGNGPWWM